MALGARERDEVVCPRRDVRVDRRLGSCNSTDGHRLGALAVAADHESDDRGADGECESDQDDQRLSCDRGDVELPADG